MKTTTYCRRVVLFGLLILTHYLMPASAQTTASARAIPVLANQTSEQYNRVALSDALSLVQSRYRISLLAGDAGVANFVVNPLTSDRIRQERTVSGVVTGDNGETLPGVSVVIKGTTKGTTTEADGNYRLSLPGGAGAVTLVFSFVGYVSQETVVGNRSVINVQLATDNKSLSEVVVVGYGTQQKRDVTGAVGSIKIDPAIAGRPAVEFGQALAGQLAGVQVISGNGRPGTSSSVQVRGINSVSAGSTPLIVIDGIPTPNYDLNLINSADIEAIDVLKDASSSAIYGSRGANGVILVTTKKGKSGQAKVNINYLAGVQEVINRVKVMNSAEYAQAAIDAAQNGWIESGGDPNAPNTIEARKQYKYTWPSQLERPETLPNTDWQSQIFRVAPIHKLDLNVSGGSEKTTFSLSGGIVKQQGIVLTSDYSKYSLGIRTNTKLRDWVDVGGMININYDQEREPFNRTTEWAIQYPSIYPVYSANGFLGGPSTEPGFQNYNAILFRPQNGHPLYKINDEIYHRRLNSLGSLFAQFRSKSGLAFKTAINYYYNRTDNSNYQTQDHQLGPTFYTEGSMTVDQSRTINYTFQNLLTYDKTIGRHTFSGLLGTEYNNNDFYFTLQERRGYDNDLIKALSAGKTVFQASDNLTRTILISYFGRLNYDLNGKYLFSASVRRDGSSRFAPNNKWGYFPALSAGWIVSEEAFLKPFRSLSNLKLRASYGYTGNDRFDDYRWIGSVLQERVAFGTNLSTTYYPSSITNPDLRWERTQQLNLGLDLGLFNNRIVLEGDFYRSESDGLLLDVPVPVVSGFTSVFKNIGKLENKGIELNLTTQNLTGALRWTTKLNFSRNRNKILALGPNDAPIIFNASVASGTQKIIQVGEPIFSFYGYQYAGVYKNQAEVDADPARYATAVPGDGRYADVNGDGKLTTADRTSIGNYNPDFIWGITNNLSYKGFDLNILFQGVQGNQILDENIHRSLLYHEGRNYLQEVTNRWRSEAEPGDGYHYKLTVNIDGYEKTPSSYFIRDGSYARLKNLTLGYTLPAPLLSKIKLASCRIYFNGTNLFTHKNSPVYDPENFNGGAGEVSRRGVISSPFPTAKIYSLGLNIGF